MGETNREDVVALSGERDDATAEKLHDRADAEAPGSGDGHRTLLSGE